MPTRGSTNKVLLAVDMSDSSVMPNKPVWRIYDTLLEQLNATAHVVHILQYPKRLLMDQDLIKDAQKELNQFVEKTAIKNYSDIRVLPGSASLSESIKVLLNYVDKHKIKMITVVSHGRRWLVRFVMGSFAEALLSKSEVPLFFLSKQTVIKSRRVLFMTDFSKPSLIAFKSFLNHFEDLKPDLIIYHALPPLYEFSGMMETYPIESRKYADHQMDDLVKLAVKSGYSVSAYIDENVIDIPKAVGKIIKTEKIALLAFSSIAKRYGVAFVGNVAKRLFRLEGVNKWVCGPGLVNKMMKKEKRKKIVRLKKERLVEVRA